MLGGERLCILPGPEAMRGQDRLGIVPGMKMQGVEKVARGHQEVGLELECLPEGSHRFVVAPLILEEVAQRIAWLGKNGVELDGPLEGGDRLVEPALDLQCTAEVVIGLGLVGLDLE